MPLDDEPKSPDEKRTRDEGGHDQGAGGRTAGEGAPDDKKSGKDSDKKSDGENDKPRSRKPFIILGVIVVVIAIAGAIYWFAHRNETSTDDAYTDGNTVTIVPKVAGYVSALYVDDNMHVHAGDLLAKIDARDFLTSRSQAEAQLALARADLASAQNSLRIAEVQYPAQLMSAQAQHQAALATAAQAKAAYLRQHEVDRRATTQENIDASTSQQAGAEANVRSAQAQMVVASLVPEQIDQARTLVAQREAQVMAAEAQLAQANLNVGYAEVRSPVEGFVTLRSVQLGSYLTPGQAMLLIVTPEIWVTANFKESQIGRMRPGDKVDVAVDAYSALHLHGHVQSIQYGSGSRFSAFPAENATGNYVKIVQRVPVKILIDDGLDPARPLPLGLSVTPVVHFP